jgi:hypothetical protein
VSRPAKKIVVKIRDKAEAVVVPNLPIDTSFLSALGAPPAGSSRSRVATSAKALEAQQSFTYSTSEAANDFDPRSTATSELERPTKLAAEDGTPAEAETEAGAGAGAEAAPKKAKKSKKKTVAEEEPVAAEEGEAEAAPKKVKKAKKKTPADEELVAAEDGLAGSAHIPAVQASETPHAVEQLSDATPVQDESETTASGKKAKKGKKNADGSVNEVRRLRSFCSDGWSYTSKETEGNTGFRGWLSLDFTTFQIEAQEGVQTCGCCVEHLPFAGPIFRFSGPRSKDGWIGPVRSIDQGTPQPITINPFVVAVAWICTFHSFPLHRSWLTITFRSRRWAPRQGYF